MRCGVVYRILCHEIACVAGPSHPLCTRPLLLSLAPPTGGDKTHAHARTRAHGARARARARAATAAGPAGCARRRAQYPL